MLAAAAIINGAALESFGLVWTHTLQDRIPANLLGRVSSIDSLGSFALLPVGYAVAGWATDRLGRTDGLHGRWGRDGTACAGCRVSSGNSIVGLIQASSVPSCP